MRALAAVLLAAMAISCATLAEGGGGRDNLPNAGAGPFRELDRAEVGQLRSAPYVLEDDDVFPRDASVLDADGDPATLEVWAYAAINVEVAGVDPDPLALPTAIARYTALDGRSFGRTADIVAVPEQAWEGGTVGAPSAVRVGAEIRLYYGAAEGIGLARSPDGLTFTREPAPVLAAEAIGWEGAAIPRSPSVVQLEDGSFRLFYEVAGADGSGRIGEAASGDGLAFTRIGTAPALAPTETAVEPGSADEPYDSASVGSPFAILGRFGEDRPLVRLYYAARDRAGGATIGLAARFGSDGPLERAVSPVFGTGSTLQPREPCVVPFEAFSFLFVTERAGRSSAKDYPAVAGAVAPALVTLPPAE